MRIVLAGVLMLVAGCCSPADRDWQIAELRADRIHTCSMDSDTFQVVWGAPDSIDIDRRRSSLARGSSRERYGEEEYVVWTYVEHDARLTFKEGVLHKLEPVSSGTR